MYRDITTHKYVNIFRYRSYLYTINIYTVYIYTHCIRYYLNIFEILVDCLKHQLKNPERKLCLVSVEHKKYLYCKATEFLYYFVQCCFCDNTLKFLCCKIFYLIDIAA